MFQDSKRFLQGLTTSPGIYQMYDVQGNVLYVGKARNLKKRLSSYFQKNLLDAKTKALMQRVADIQVIITHTETEALLLENNFIKEFKPPYNILFRDDKSYPYIFISNDTYPRMSIYRGAKTEKGEYFGPYPSAVIAKKTVHFLQKIFKIRSCKNSSFLSRNRPCLQYQIKRCQAPCVGFINIPDYDVAVSYTKLYLQGKSSVIVDQLVKKMDEAALKLDYELAANLRDQIQELRVIQREQHINTHIKNADALGIEESYGTICLVVLMIREGRILGSKIFCQQGKMELSQEEVLGQFLSQYYLDQKAAIPAEVILPARMHYLKSFEKLLSQQAGKKIRFLVKVRGDRAQWLDMAQLSAEQALQNHLLKQSVYYKKFSDLQITLELAQLPRRIECFDVSHMMGEATVAACVVFDIKGSLKNDYRKFNIENEQAGDDFAAMRQALHRYYVRLLKERPNALPDVLLIDGGKGQLKQAEDVLSELQIQGVTLLGVAKGVARKLGQETLWTSRRKDPILLDNKGKSFHLIQEIRDEAHRFAITGHRKKRSQLRRISILENITGIGPKRRQLLLKAFGGMQGLKQASVNDLNKIPGIQRTLAQRIYEMLHT